MPRRPKIKDEPVGLAGLKYLRSFLHVPEPPEKLPSHGNRELLYHQYVALLLLGCYHPLLGPLRALREATELAEVRGLWA